MADKKGISPDAPPNQQGCNDNVDATTSSASTSNNATFNALFDDDSTLTPRAMDGAPEQQRSPENRLNSPSSRGVRRINENNSATEGQQHGFDSLFHTNNPSMFNANPSLITRRPSSSSRTCMGMAREQEGHNFYFQHPGGMLPRPTPPQVTAPVMRSQPQQQQSQQSSSPSIACLQSVLQREGNNFTFTFKGPMKPNSFVEQAAETGPTGPTGPTATTDNDDCAASQRQTKRPETMNNGCCQCCCVCCQKKTEECRGNPVAQNRIQSICDAAITAATRNNVPRIDNFDVSSISNNNNNGDIMETIAEYASAWIVALVILGLSLELDITPT